MTVTVTEAGSGTQPSDSDSFDVTVHNVAPTVVLTGADEVDEGDTETYNYTVSDPGVNDTFTVDAGFPDCDFGATNNGVLVGTPVQTATGGSFKCSFPDGDATATVKIKVTDNDGGSSTDSEDVVIVEIANVAPEVTAAADQSSDEGESKSFDLGSFTDPGDDADWTVDVDWGDGGSDSFTTASKGALGGFFHTYADGPNDYVVTVTVTDKDGASDSATFAVHVRNVAPTVELTGAASADEGDTVTYTYTVVDPGADTPAIEESCGDEGDYVDTPEPLSFDCTFPDGPKNSTVKVTADDGVDVGSDEIAVTVHNVAPTVVLTGADEVDEGDVETYSYTVEDPGVNDTFTVDADFPDCDAGGANGVLVGTPVQTASGGSFVCRFPDGDKTATVKVKVTDNDGGSTTDSEDVVIVEIANVAPVVTAAANQSSDEGESKSFDLGSFTDPGDDADWTVSVDWGDGSTMEFFTKDAAGSLGTLAHTYADGPAIYTVTVVVVDKDDAADSATFDVTVANVAPTVELSGEDSANEGQTNTYTYTVVDPGDDDPETTESCGDEGDYVDTPAPDSFDCTFPDGPKGSRVEVIADDGDSSNNIGSDYIDVTIHNVAPKVTLTGDEHVDEGDTETYTYTVEDPGVRRHVHGRLGLPRLRCGRDQQRRAGRRSGADRARRQLHVQVPGRGRDRAREDQGHGQRWRQHGRLRGRRGRRHRQRTPVGHGAGQPDRRRGRGEGVQPRLVHGPGARQPVVGGHRLGRLLAARDVHGDHHREPRLSVAHVPEWPGDQDGHRQGHGQERGSRYDDVHRGRGERQSDREHSVVHVRPGARNGDGELQLRGRGLEGHPHGQLLPLEHRRAGRLHARDDHRR